MSASPAPGFGFVEAFDVSFREEQATHSSTVLESGREYTAIVSGTGQLKDDADRDVDAEYAYSRGDGRSAANGSKGLDFGLKLGLGSPADVNFGGFQSDRVYSNNYTGNGSPLAGLINDRSGGYDDNSGSLSVSIWEQILLDSITVSSDLNAQQTGTAFRPNLPAPSSLDTLYLGLPRTGGHSVSVELNGDTNQSTGYKSMLAWMIEGGQTSGPSRGTGTSSTSLSLLEGASYTFTAWADWDGNGRVNGDEASLTLGVETVSLDELEVASDAHRANRVSGVPVGPDTGTLYVELEDGTSYTPLYLGAATTGNFGGDLELEYAVLGGSGITGVFSGNSVDNALLTAPGQTHVVGAGFDLNGDNTLDESEFVVDIEAVLVRVDELYVEDRRTTNGQTFSKRTSSESDKPSIYVVQDEQTQKSRINLDVFGVPLSTDAGQHVLYTITGGAVEGEPRGNFGGADPSRILSPGTGAAGRDYEVKIGFDDNGNGMLEGSEVSRTIEVLPVYVKVETPTSPATLLDQTQYKVEVLVGGGGSPGETKLGGRRVGATDFDQIATGSGRTLNHSRTERVTGFFEWVGTTELDGRIFASADSAASSNHPVVEVQFVDQAAIGADQAVRRRTASEFDAANQFNINDPSNRILERGFWISLNTDTGQYEISSTYVGDPVNANAAVTLSKVGGPSFFSVKPQDSHIDPSLTDRPTYTVGWSHTHPAQTYSSDGFSRPTGASTFATNGQNGGDEGFSVAVGLPGFVQDYIGVGGRLSDGHNINSPSIFSDVPGVSRRVTPS